MKTAVLILAHKDPAQLGRLCRALKHPEVTVFVHLDAKTDMGPFGGIGDAVFIRDRVKVRWGGFSQVRAVLNSMREIIGREPGTEFMHLISGQDFPVAPIGDILREQASPPGASYLGYTVVEGDSKYMPAMRRRYERLHYFPDRPMLKKAAYVVANAVCPRARRPPLYPVYKGSQWFSITRECMEYILGFCRDNPDYVRFFRRVQIPDEMFFHTIIMHSLLAESTVCDNRRYIKWSEGSPNPDLLTAADLPAMTGGGYWFARKFCGGEPALDILEALIGGPQV